MPTYYVYILANRPGGALYIGMTSDLLRRLDAHRNAQVKGFTQTYGLKTLVYFETTTDVLSADRKSVV